MIRSPSAGSPNWIIRKPPNHVARLEEISGQYGPFDIVIDDASHIVNHQAVTMRCLLPLVHPGGFYVIEDTHASVKKPGPGPSVDYGADIWADFTMAVLQRFRKGPSPPQSAGALLAREIVPLPVGRHGHPPISSADDGPFEPFPTDWLRQ